MKKEKHRLFFYFILLAFLVILVAYVMMHHKDEKSDEKSEIEEITNIVSRIYPDAGCYVDDLTDADKAFLENYFYGIWQFEERIAPLCEQAYDSAASKEVKHSEWNFSDKAQQTLGTLGIDIGDMTVSITKMEPYSMENSDALYLPSWGYYEFENPQDSFLYGIYGGYGLSETFSGVSIGRNDAFPRTSKPIVSVGVIQAGMIAGIFDKDGNELPYNHRGELKVKAPSQMKGYYNKQQLTDETIVDGWIKTGDIAEIDEDGFLYVWGRAKNAIKSSDVENLYLFDVEAKIRENEFIHDVVVLPMSTDEFSKGIVVHIVWNENILKNSKQEYIEEINKQLQSFLPKSVEVLAYAEHDTMLPYSPTTLKKDRNKMSKQTSDFIQVIDGQMYNIEFVLNENGKYSQKCDIIEKDKVKHLSRK